MTYQAGIVMLGSPTGEENDEWLKISIDNLLDTIFEFHAPVPKELTLYSGDGTFLRPLAQAILKREWQLDLCIHADHRRDFDTRGIEFSFISEDLERAAPLGRFLRRFERYILVTNGSNLPELLKGRYFEQVLDLSLCIPRIGIEEPKRIHFD